MNFARRSYWRMRGWLTKPDTPSSATAGTATAQNKATLPAAVQTTPWWDDLVTRVLLFESPTADDFVAVYPKYLDLKRAPLVALEKQLADLLADTRVDVNNAWAEFPDLIHRALEGHPLERPFKNFTRKEE